MESKCRLCMKANPEKLITPQIAEHFFCVMNIKLKSDFSLPNTVCNQCLAELSQLRKVTEKWRKSEEHWTLASKTSFSDDEMWTKPRNQLPVVVLAENWFDPLFGDKLVKSNMAKCVAPGCGRSFKNSRGLKVHKRYCDKKLRQKGLLPDIPCSSRIMTLRRYSVK